MVAVRKSFTIAPAAIALADSDSSSGGLVLESGTVGAGSGAGGNTPPVIKAGESYAAVAGESFSIATSIADSDGDTVSIKWVLMQEASGATRSGSGPLVVVPVGSPQGAYQLLISATDPRGAVGEGTARVTVRAAVPAPPLPPAAPPGTGSGLPLPVGASLAPAPSAAVPQTPASPWAAPLLGLPSIYGPPLALMPRLVAWTLYQGAVLDLDAAASGLFNLSRSSWRADLAAASCTWTLAPAAAGAGRGAMGASGSGGATASVYGCASPARFKLSVPGEYTLTLRIAGRPGAAVASASCAVSVLTRPHWAQFYTAATPQGFAEGRCTPTQFAASEFRKVTLSCSGVSLPEGWGADQGLDGARQSLAFAWRLTALTRSAAAAHPVPLMRSPAVGPLGGIGGGVADFGALAPGVYAAEVVGELATAGTASVASGNTAIPTVVYSLLGLLVVEPSARLAITGAPPVPACAGAPVTLAVLPLALLAGQAAAPAAWRLVWLDARAAVGKELTLGGNGGAFSFTPQPGRYLVNATVDVAAESVAGVRRLAASATLDARPCLACRSGPVTLQAAQRACAPSAADAVALLSSRPVWLAAAPLMFAPGSSLQPGGPRRVSVIARAALTPGLADNCSVSAVSVRDGTPPVVSLHHASGACTAPATSAWACWPSAAALVNATDNCAALRPVTVRAACDPAGAPGVCRVLADGRVCVLAAAVGGSGGDDSSSSRSSGTAVGSVGSNSSMGAGAAPSSWQGASLLVRAIDGFGNPLAQPLRVPVTVYRSATSGCLPPSLATLPAD